MVSGREYVTSVKILPEDYPMGFYLLHGTTFFFIHYCPRNFWRSPPLHTIVISDPGGLWKGDKIFPMFLTRGTPSVFIPPPWYDVIFHSYWSMYFLVALVCLPKPSRTLPSSVVMTASLLDICVSNLSSNLQSLFLNLSENVAAVGVERLGVSHRYWHNATYQKPLAFGILPDLRKWKW